VEAVWEKREKKDEGCVGEDQWEKREAPYAHLGQHWSRFLCWGCMESDSLLYWGVFWGAEGEGVWFWGAEVW